MHIHAKAIYKSIYKFVAFVQSINSWKMSLPEASTLAGKLIISYMQYPGFERILKDVRVISVGNGKSLAEYTISVEATNFTNMLHGGFAAALVDVLSSLAVHWDKNDIVPVVSVDLHLSYLKGANIGEEIEIEADILRTGGHLTHISVEIRNKVNKVLLVKALHTMYTISE